MRKTLILALVAATALTLSATSWGAKPTPAATLTIAIAPNPVTFATKSTISGTISSKAAGVQLILEVLPYPYTGKYTDTGTATTAADGSYLFTVTPPTSTRYRVTSVDKPKITSPEATLAIKWRVGLKVSDST
ncbi:MAG: hypothetical protein JWM73_97, partial [Solirubrobacterales bacterium]|nr:hypothetical protein [Solirubrobacterales bacterium]